MELLSRKNTATLRKRKKERKLSFCRDGFRTLTVAESTSTWLSLFLASKKRSLTLARLIERDKTMQKNECRPLSPSVCRPERRPLTGLQSWQNNICQFSQDLEQHLSNISGKICREQYHSLRYYQNARLSNRKSASVKYRNKPVY